MQTAISLATTDGLWFVLMNGSLIGKRDGYTSERTATALALKTLNGLYAFDQTKYAGAWRREYNQK